MKTYTIPQNDSGSIHSIADSNCARDIVFATGCKFAVVLASYYGGKGYTTHKTEGAAITASQRQKDFSHVIIDTDGNEYDNYYGEKLVKN